jgi:hypothetical protein
MACVLGSKLLFAADVRKESPPDLQIGWRRAAQMSLGGRKVKQKRRFWIG